MRLQVGQDAREPSADEHQETSTEPRLTRLIDSASTGEMSITSSLPFACLMCSVCATVLET